MKTLEFARQRRHVTSPACAGNFDVMTLQRKAKVYREFRTERMSSDVIVYDVDAACDQTQPPQQFERGCACG
jgi:hypothetical protein